MMPTHPDPAPTPFDDRPRLDVIRTAGRDLRPGDRVRLRPRTGGDIVDLALRGKTATIATIEQDFEDRVFLAVTVDDDPGRDLGREGKPGHRFFFKPDEVEPLDSREEHS